MMETGYTILKHVSELKKGEYFKFAGKKKIYLVSKVLKHKVLYDWVEDMLSGGFEIKRTSKRMVDVDFEY